MLPPQPNLLLIGPRGSGKSTIGAAVAAACGRPFVDLDDLVLDRFPEPDVAGVWAVRGEAAWRKAEAEVLEEVLRADGRIVALGGGTPMIEAARDRLRRARGEGGALVVYLRSDSDDLMRRLRSDPGDRPSLTGADVRDEMAGVLREREPTYLALADHVCETTARDLPEIVSEILRVLEPPDWWLNPGGPTHSRQRHIRPMPPESGTTSLLRRSVASPITPP